MKTAKTFAATAAFAICAAVTATASMATWQENAATPAVTLAVNSDMTLSEALTANGVSLAGAASLVKTGTGTVTIDDASGIGSFAGEIHVFQGGWSVGTASGFGTASGATWVYPNGCVLFTDVTVSRSGEVFHLAGTGKSDSYGHGALRIKNSSQASSAPVAGSYGSRWILEDDATVLVWGPDNADKTGFLPSIDLVLNGHELTLYGSNYGTPGNKRSYGYFNSVTGAGGIVLRNGIAMGTAASNSHGFAQPGGSAANYVVLQNARLFAWSGDMKNTVWGLVARPTPLSDWHGNATTQAALMPKISLFSWGSVGNAQNHDFNVWPTPVTLEGDLWVQQYSSPASRAEPMTFTNKVSGVGGLTVASENTWLYLDSPENDFEGGVTLYGPNDRLVLANNGALPADGGRLLMTNSTVAFPASVAADWSLPALELAGTSVVTNGQGNWASVTALPGADVSYYSLLGADDLVLRQNAKLALRPTHFNRADYNGWEERYDLEHGLTNVNDFTANISIQTSPRYAENDNFKFLKDSDGAQKTKKRSFIYKTYLWNDSPTNETWTFACHFVAPMRVWLNGELNLNKSIASYQPFRKTGTLKPGANSLVILAYECDAGATGGGNNAAWASVQGFVYAIGDVPITDADKFVSFSATDPGDGTLCTTMSGDEALDGVQWRPHFKALAMEAGSVLDLDGDVMSVERATGSGIVTNGSLTVTQSLQASPSVFAPNGGLSVDGKLVLGAGATISFANSDDFRKRAAGLYPLATASEGIEGFTGPSMLQIDGSHRCWKANLSADGKTLSLELVSEGFVFIVR